MTDQQQQPAPREVSQGTPTQLRVSRPPRLAITGRRLGLGGR